MQHRCIKSSCGKVYEENDPDAYFCYSCREENKKLAEKIDTQIRPSRKTESMIGLYDKLPKIHGFPSAKDFL